MDELFLVTILSLAISHFFSSNCQPRLCWSLLEVYDSWVQQQIRGCHVGSCSRQKVDGNCHGAQQLRSESRVRGGLTKSIAPQTRGFSYPGLWCDPPATAMNPGNTPAPALLLNVVNNKVGIFSPIYFVVVEMKII